MTGTARVAIIDGARTPFQKAGSGLKKLSLQDLGRTVLEGLAQRNPWASQEIEEFVFGTVLLDPRTPNWAREILFSSSLPRSIYAQSVSNNCISGLVAITNVAERIALGQISSGIGGGTESMSRPSLTVHPGAEKFFISLGRARTLPARLKLLTTFKPKYLLPVSPKVTEPSTGLSMGEHMEITAKELSIAREAQDEFAVGSHHRAHKAQSEGFFKGEIIPTEGTESDNIIRGDSSLKKLSSLPPVFDRSERGTLTAGNSSALTDGASAVLLTSEAKASTLGVTPLAYIKDYEYAALDPAKGLLMAPAITVPKLLSRHGLTLADFDYIEIHEAFAAQVLANIRAWEDGLMGPALGKIPMERVNVAGGSLAIGHPFSATGGRLVTTAARLLAERGGKRALISICAAGGMAGAMLIER